MKPNLTLYVREGCHLCEAFLDEFIPYAQRNAIAYVLIDVDTSEQISQAYGQRVPLLMADTKVICEYFFDPVKIDEYVQRVKVG